MGHVLIKVSNIKEEPVFMFVLGFVSKLVREEEYFKSIYQMTVTIGYKMRLLIFFLNCEETDDIRDFLFCFPIYSNKIVKI